MALGISESTVGMYERDQREPDFEMLEAIADYFNVDMDFLTGRTTVRRAYTYTPSRESGSSVVPSAPSDNASLSHDEEQLITDYRELTPPGKEYIRQTMAMAKISYSEKKGPVPELEAAD